MTGQYLDMALHNNLKPGVEATDQIPAGLNLGKSLTLIPVEPSKSTHGSTPAGKIPDVQIKITEYWGCGAAVRAGQPKVATFTLKGGNKAIDPNNPMGAMMQAMQMVNKLKQAGNPQAAVEQMAQTNPNVKKAMDMCKGKNPKQVFEEMCRQNGMDPGQFSGLMK